MRRYDLVFGLGSACSCTQALRVAGLQFMSFPLDWVSGSRMVDRAKLVANGFVDWLRMEDFERVENPEAFGHDTYRNRWTNLTHPHDFAHGALLAKSYPEVREKYDRRVARLKVLLSSVRHVLVVWIGDPRDHKAPEEEEIRASLALLSRSWPQVSFRMLVLDCVHGLTLDARREMHAHDYDRLSFDYACHASDAKPWSVEPDLLGMVLADYACADYRTGEERRAERIRKRKREWQRFGAASVWSYWVNKLEYKLWRHLLRGLKRDGVNRHCLMGKIEK